MRYIGQKGFTLPELLAASGFILVVIALSLILIHPKDFTTPEQNAQRQLGIAELMQAINVYASQNGNYPSGITNIANNIGSFTGELNLCPVLVPKYMKQIPVDPIIGLNTSCEKNATYLTGYTIRRSGNGYNDITISVLGSVGKSISLTN
jgi:type II secretory pathway pseudopilin PulG